MFNSELRPVTYKEDGRLKNSDGSRALFERSEEPEFSDFQLDYYVSRYLAKNTKIAGQRLA